MSTRLHPYLAFRWNPTPHKHTLNPHVTTPTPLHPRTTQASEAAPESGPEPSVPTGVWQAIKAEYRTGVLISFLSEKYGVDLNLIVQKRRAEQWTRDLREEIQAEVATRLVIDEMSPQSRGDDDAIIDAAAGQGAVVVRKHRTVLGGHLDGLAETSAELSQQIKDLRVLRALVADELAGPLQDLDARDVLMDRLASIDKQIRYVASAQLDVSNSLARIVPNHRIAFGLNDKQTEKPYEEYLREFHAALHAQRQKAVDKRAERAAAGG